MISKGLIVEPEEEERGMLDFTKFFEFGGTATGAPKKVETEPGVQQMPICDPTGPLVLGGPPAPSSEQATYVLTTPPVAIYELEEKIRDLREYLSKYSPHRRLFAHSGLFFGFFFLAWLSDDLLGVPIIEPFWNNLGMLISFLFGVMAAFLKKDLEM